MFGEYSDNDLNAADSFTDAILKFLKDYDCGDSEVVVAQVEDLIKTFEAASLALFDEIQNRQDA